MLRWICIIILLLPVACKEHATPATMALQTGPATNNKNVTGPPEAITDYIQTNFPGWRMVNRNDYNKAWWSFYDSSHISWWVTTDFNDDQVADHALLLTNNRQLRLVICMGSDHRRFTHWIANDFQPVANGNLNNLSFGIAIEPPAQIDVVNPKEQSLILKSNGITLMELEERVRVYYWQEGGIQTFHMK